MNYIAAVIVTYQRNRQLIELIKSVLEQSTPVKSIYIVDNNDNDSVRSDLVKQFLLEEDISEDTEVYRKIRYVLSYNSKKIFVVYIKMVLNAGGAGGFHYGIKNAIEDNHDWVFLTDDDVVLKKDTLEKLFKYSSQSRCLQANRILNNGKVLTQPGYFDFTLGRTIFLNEELSSTLDYYSSNYGCFEGMLIHKEIIEKVGLPDPDIFINGDDIIYGFMISSYTKIFFIGDAILIKSVDSADGSTIPRSYYNPSRLKTYYNVRNQLLIFAYLKSMKHLHSSLAFSIFYIKLLNTFFRCLVRGKFHHIVIVFRGLIDGTILYHKKFGDLASKNRVKV